MTTKKRSSTKKRPKTTSLKNSTKGFSSRQAIYFSLVIALIGGFVIWRSFAATSVTFNAADKLITAKSSGATVGSESSGKSTVKYVQMTGTNSYAALNAAPIEPGNYQACVTGNTGGSEVNGRIVMLTGGQLYENTYKVSSTSYGQIGCVQFAQIASANKTELYVTADKSIKLTNVSIGPISGNAPTPSGPVRAMFYYPWFPEAWNQQGFNPFTNFTPTAGQYSSVDTTTINRHIDTMIYAGMNSAIYSWWGQGTKEDTRFPSYLSATGTKPLKWALYYEMEGQGNPSVAQLQNDLSYIKTKYASNPNYRKVGGKPLLFVWADDADRCAMATSWKQANVSQDFYVVLKVFPDYSGCADQPDNWHQYGFNMTTGNDSQGHRSFTIGPGYWKKGCPYGGGTCTQGDTQPFMERDLAKWTNNVNVLKGANVNFQLVTSFNEWGEGSSVESANGTMPRGWPSASGYGQFIDTLHNVLVE